MQDFSDYFTNHIKEIHPYRQRNGHDEEFEEDDEEDMKEMKEFETRSLEDYNTNELASTKKVES